LTLPSSYNPHDVESHWYDQWEKAGLFKPSDQAQGDPFTIVIPPPNVTGILHMGHALNNTLQDILIRFKRMQGRPTLWVPGTDHAGIATQNVVERKLGQAGKSRHDLGREKFIKQVWDWKEHHGSTIVNQLRRLGASCDWSRERFTMDEGLSEAVQTTFLQLHKEGLIYRGYYLVNWCPRCQTALSDEEVQHEDVKGNLWYIRYPAADGSEGVVVATTRPETLLGDVAVAVHPKDDRFKGLHGQEVMLPVLNKKLPIITDPTVEREFGTGAVKITPAHDPTDFMLGQKHNLKAIRVMTADGKMNDLAGPYKGIDRFEARKQIVKQLKDEALLEKIEDYDTSIGHC
jgi:valyl-tRNA synthetase